MMKNVVDWVQSAHKEIQLRSPTWGFDWDSATPPLTPGKTRYEPVGDWALQVKTMAPDGVVMVGPGGVLNWVSELSWAQFRQMQPVTGEGLPAYFAIAPDKALHLSTAPPAGWTLRLDYYRRPQVLLASTDEPRMPEEYHMAIVWRAVMMWCAHDENEQLLARVTPVYRDLVRKMLFTETPSSDIGIPEALA